MFLACLAGLATAIASILGWRVLSLAAGYRAYYAALIALFVAWSMTLVGRRSRGPALQIASSLVVLTTLALGNYVVVAALVKQFAASHQQPIVGLVGFDLFWRSFRQLLYPMDPLFFFVGLLFAAFIPRRTAPPVQGPSD